MHLDSGNSGIQTPPSSSRVPFRAGSSCWKFLLSIHDEVTAMIMCCICKCRVFSRALRHMLPLHSHMCIKAWQLPSTAAAAADRRVRTVTWPPTCFAMLSCWVTMTSGLSVRGGRCWMPYRHSCCPRQVEHCQACNSEPQQPAAEHTCFPQPLLLSTGAHRCSVFQACRHACTVVVHRVPLYNPMYRAGDVPGPIPSNLPPWLCSCR